MTMSASQIRSTGLAVCVLVFSIAIESASHAQSAASDQPKPGTDVAKPLDPMAWIVAAQDLRIAAQTTDQIADKIGTTVERTMLHVAQASHGFDPLGLKAAMETVRQQNDMLRQQHETILAAMKSENRRLNRENRRLKKSLRQAKEQANVTAQQ
jgi:hypothetical protein